MNEESLHKKAVISNDNIDSQEAATIIQKGFRSGYMQVSNCQGSHRYFVAETFAVEGEGTVGAVVICTACGESKLIIHKVANPSSSISLKEK